ncbi:hypothetical protein C8Q79DRAFT_635749 [Trametes meyenii]|nr:hypothetical protein C8Q79DRAFT_635749 [Trametes meyenii]
MGTCISASVSSPSVYGVRTPWAPGVYTIHYTDTLYRYTSKKARSEHHAPRPVTLRARAHTTPHPHPHHRARRTTRTPLRQTLNVEPHASGLENCDPPIFSPPQCPGQAQSFAKPRATATPAPRCRVPGAGRSHPCPARDAKRSAASPRRSALRSQHWIRPGRGKTATRRRGGPRACRCGLRWEGRRRRRRRWWWWWWWWW